MDCVDLAFLKGQYPGLRICKTDFSYQPKYLFLEGYWGIVFHQDWSQYGINWSQEITKPQPENEVCIDDLTSPIGSTHRTH